MGSKLPSHHRLFTVEPFAGYHHLREIDELELQDILERSVRGLHNLNLQRCDRVITAHGLEARVPF